MENIEARAFLKRSDAAFDFITAHVGSEFPSRVLDVGCGEGYLLSLFKGKGSFIVGVDPSIIRRSAGAERYGIREFYPSLQELEKTRGNILFDLIILSHLLEHLDNPKYFMKDLLRLVKKTGFIYIEVPAISRAAQAPESVIHLTHIHHFTTLTLVEFCRHMGLETVISKDDIIDGYPCSRVLVKHCDKLMGGHNDGEGINKKEITNAKASFGSLTTRQSSKFRHAAIIIRHLARKGEVAIFGGGSDTCHLLHEFPDLPAVGSRIIDSDRNKSGLKLCGIRIEGPEALLSVSQPNFIFVSAMSSQIRKSMERTLSELNVRSKQVIHLFE